MCKEGLGLSQVYFYFPTHLCPCKTLQQWSPLHFICLQTDGHGGNLTGG